MTTLREAAQQALEYLDAPSAKLWPAGTQHRVITALKTALAEPVQEPVAWMYTGIKQDGTEHGPHLVWKPAYMDAMSASKGAQATPLYTAPPQRPAEPVEPVAWLRLRDGKLAVADGGNFGNDWMPLYTAPHGIGGQDES